MFKITKSLGWLCILAVTIENLGFFLGWMFFNPIPYQTASYFNTSLLSIDNLLIVQSIAIVIGQSLSLYTADKNGLSWPFLCAIFFGIFAIIGRAILFSDLLSDKSNLVPLLYAVQILESFAVSCTSLLTTKITSIWFVEKDRLIANIVGSQSQFLALITVYPLGYFTIVGKSSDDNYQREFANLAWVSID